MTLRFIEGFETRQHSDYYDRVYGTYAGATGENTAGSRKGYGRSIRGTNMQFTTRALVSSVENTWICQFAIRKPDQTDMGSNYGTFQLQDSSGDQMEVRWVAAPSPNTGCYVFEVRRGTTVLATSSPFHFGNTGRNWNVFQFKVTVRTGTDGAYEMKGWDWKGTPFTVFAATTGVNLANQGTDGADRVFFRPNNGGTAALDMDDIVVMDGSGSVNNDFTSVPVLVYGELPDGDVAGEIDFVRSSGSTNSGNVNDAATVSFSSDEVTTDQTGAVDLYTFSSADLDLIPTGSPPTVLGIMVDMEALMKTSGSMTIRTRFKDSTNQADDTTDLTYSDTAKISRYALVEQNPTGTPAAWDVATLKTIELGPKTT